MPLIELCAFVNAIAWPSADRIVTRCVVCASGRAAGVFVVLGTLQYSASGLSETSPMIWP